MTRPAVAIIGFGDFSKLMVKHLAPHFRVLITTRQEKINKHGLDFEQVDLKTALAQDVIIPSIPAQFLEEFFSTNTQLINPKAIVIDVCSVKVKPVKILRKVLPETIQILATHPMFGSATAQNGLGGQKIMLYPVRINPQKYQTIKNFLQQTLELDVIEATPEQHDRIMAYAQGLSHYIGRAMQLMDIPEDRMTTKAYNDLLDMKRIQGSDSLELFKSIMFENPYALTVNKKFKKILKELDQQLGIK